MTFTALGWEQGKPAPRPEPRMKTGDCRGIHKVPQGLINEPPCAIAAEMMTESQPLVLGFHRGMIFPPEGGLMEEAGQVTHCGHDREVMGLSWSGFSCWPCPPSGEAPKLTLPFGQMSVTTVLASWHCGPGSARSTCQGSAQQLAPSEHQQM